jgi:transcriptional accessory protein Tex/SPT6
MSRRGLAGGEPHCLFGLITRLEGGSEIARTDALDQFVPDETLEELIASIERDIAADKPAAALDRLHTYCAKKFGHLLDARSIEWKRDEPLQSRVGIAGNRTPLSLGTSCAVRGGSRFSRKKAVVTDRRV